MNVELLRLAQGLTFALALSLLCPANAADLPEPQDTPLFRQPSETVLSTAASLVTRIQQALKSEQRGVATTREILGEASSRVSLTNAPARVAIALNNSTAHQAALQDDIEALAVYRTALITTRRRSGPPRMLSLTFPTSMAP